MGEILSALTWTDAVGTVGTMIVVSAYFATQMRYLNSDDLLFPVVNMVGSMMIGFSLFFNFNFASALIEFFWICISLFGVVQGLKRRKAKMS
ncbi:CBU_0592 family membrane protein [Cochlodiniinecator piscidefendens]|uniref:CBU_0592 family membrane protein n=1 Tax=Cochlodiniinecator piscidefendens TaxID=2715756 RepID=UPI00140B5B15|nr:hypothetical protein [Cochlodiniinecator piscidefendens]